MTDGVGRVVTIILTAGTGVLGVASAFAGGFYGISLVVVLVFRRIRLGLGLVVVLIAVTALGTGVQVVAFGRCRRCNSLVGVAMTSCLGFVTTVAVTAGTGIFGIALAFAGRSDYLAGVAVLVFVLTRSIGGTAIADVTRVTRNGLFVTGFGCLGRRLSSFLGRLGGCFGCVRSTFRSFGAFGSVGGFATMVVLVFAESRLGGHGGVGRADSGVAVALTAEQAEGENNDKDDSENFLHSWSHSFL